MVADNNKNLTKLKTFILKNKVFYAKNIYNKKFCNLATFYKKTRVIILAMISTLKITHFWCKSQEQKCFLFFCCVKIMLLPYTYDIIQIGENL